MARGWESKSVEDQMAAAEAKRADAPRPELSAAQQEMRSRKADLLLARTRTTQSLQAACNPLHRALLERTLDHINAQLRDLE